MAIYFQEHELDNRELNDYLTAWPTKLVDGSYVIASHADLVAEVDFDTAPATVNAAISSTLQAAGVSAAKDAIAPDWVVVTLPADSEYPAEEVSVGRFGTVWETRAKDLEQHTFCFVGASESQNLRHHLNAWQRLAAWVIASGQINDSAFADAKILGHRFGLVQSIVP